MSKEILNSPSVDRLIPPEMPGRRKLIQLAAGLIAGGTFSGLSFVPPAVAQPAGGRRILIAYYSRTGTTREVAKQIQKNVGGTLFELRTMHRYPDEYRPTTQQAKRELEEGFRPQLATPVDAMETYDTVFIGFPNWWGTMPMAFFSFLEQYPLDGKTVIPFCTHEGSSFGRSLDDLRANCGGARILDGLALRGGGVGRVARESVQKEIREWLRGLGLGPGAAA